MICTLLEGTYTICRLPPDAPAPALAHGWVSLTRTPEEVSIVCREADAPPGAVRAGAWRMLMVAGPLDFSLTGVLASLAVPLAAAGVSIFAVSTYNTDYLLVPARQLELAKAALAGAGHTIQPNV